MVITDTVDDRIATSSWATPTTIMEDKHNKDMARTRDINKTTAKAITLQVRKTHEKI